MADEQSHVPRTKTRSASICATSLEAFPSLGNITNGGTPQNRRRKPANRSQSARLNSNRSFKKKTAVAASNPLDNKDHCNSEPKLTEPSENTPHVSPNIKRKTSSSKRGTSVYHRKSTAFLDVPDSRPSSEKHDEENEDSYRLRSFSFTSKGKIFFLQVKL